MIVLNPLVHNNKYCLLKEELLLPLPQLRKLSYEEVHSEKRQEEGR